MPSFPGPLEVLVIAVIALLVFGPERLPQIAKQVGRAAAELRRMAAEVKDEFDSSYDTAEDEAQSAGRSREESRGSSSGDEPPGGFDRADHPSAPDGAAPDGAAPDDGRI